MTIKWNRENLSWVAGLIEGEGCITQSRGHWTLTVRMTDEDVLRSALDIIGFGKLYGPYRHPSHKDHFKTNWVLSMQNEHEIYPFVVAIFTFLHSRRRGKIKEFLEDFNSRKPLNQCKKGHIRPYRQRCKQCFNEWQKAYRAKG